MTALVPFRPRPPGRFGRWFLRRFGTAVTIEVRASGLHASGAGRDVHVPQTMAGVAPLFGGAAGPGDYDALVHTIRRLLAEIVATRRLPVKPSVTWRGLATLGAPGYLAMTLERATYDAGAQEVHMEPTPSQARRAT